MSASKVFPPGMLHPKHPERICWGCDELCPADELACANGAVRTQHLVELFGDDWEAFFSEGDAAPAPAEAE